jgi:hypothetical protein
MDELTPFSEEEVVLAGDVLTHPVGRYIDGLLDESTDAVRLIAPLRRLRLKTWTVYEWQEEPLSESLVFYTGKQPLDFLRIGYIKMAGWRRSVTEVTPLDSEAYRMLRNPYTTAGPNKPAVAVVDGRLELYGSRVGGAAAPFACSYVAQEYFSSEPLVVDAQVFTAICWRCAMATLSVMGRQEAAKQAKELFERIRN